MKWTDLKENDILEYNPEFLRKFKERFGVKIEQRYPVIEGHIDRFHVVKSVMRSNKDEITICFRNVETPRRPPAIPIKEINGALFEFPDGPPVFKIVSISKEIKNARKNSGDDK